MSRSDMFQIGDVAEAVGLSLRTIRYYEEVGLVVPSGRSTGGFRLYTSPDIDRLALVKRLKPLDLSIDEIRDLLTVRDRLADPSTPDAEREHLTERLEIFAALANERCIRIREQLDAAEAMRAMLREELTQLRARPSSEPGRRQRVERRARHRN